jgi:hypothetical protein
MVLLLIMHVYLALCVCIFGNVQFGPKLPYLISESQSVMLLTCIILFLENTPKIDLSTRTLPLTASNERTTNSTLASPKAATINNTTTKEKKRSKPHHKAASPPALDDSEEP